MISSVIDKFKDLWYGEAKEEVEGYLIMADSTTNKSLLLVKNSEKSWKTQWFNDTTNNYKTPSKSLHTIFNISK